LIHVSRDTIPLKDENYCIQENSQQTSKYRILTRCLKKKPGKSGHKRNSSVCRSFISVVELHHFHAAMAPYLQYM
jgi:hypothetical protein